VLVGEGFPGGLGAAVCVASMSLELWDRELPPDSNFTFPLNPPSSSSAVLGGSTTVEKKISVFLVGASLFRLVVLAAAVAAAVGVVVLVVVAASWFAMWIFPLRSPFCFYAGMFNFSPFFLFGFSWTFCSPPLTWTRARVCR